KKVPPRLLAPFQGNGAEKSASHSPLHHPPISRLNAQTINSNLNFTAATFPDCSGWPPDTMGTVGPTQFIIALNGRIRSFNKTTGLADDGINANSDIFFASVMTSGPNFTTDPRIRYDRLSGRW